MAGSKLASAYEKGHTPFKRMRLMRGYSQVRLAAMANTAPRTIVKLDRGKGTFTTPIGTLLKIAMVLDCTPVDLVPELGIRVPRPGRGPVYVNEPGQEFKEG